METLNNLDKTKKLISQKKLLQFGYVVIFVNDIGIRPKYISAY
jgi:hypothetical protein